MNSKIITIIILGIALICSLVLGSDIAAEDYESLSTYAIVVVVIYFILQGWKNVWWLTSFLVFSGVVFYQGFVFNAEHLFVLMLCLASVISILSRRKTYSSRIMLNAGLDTPVLLIGLLLLYGAIHFAITVGIPYDPLQFSIKTVLKAYFECFTTMTAFIWLAKSPYQFALKSNWVKLFLTILFCAIFGNVLAKGFLYLQGFQAVDGENTGNLQNYFLYVPVINMQAGIYTLRDLSPIAVAILAAFVTAPGWWVRQRWWLRAMVIAALFLCLGGAVFSGGRITLLFCIGLLGIVALVRKKILWVVFASGSGLICIAVVNMFSNWVNEEAPYYISRSLQLVLIEKGDAYQTISGSQDTREAAISEAYKIWKEEPRVTIIGRSVLAITTEEANYVSKNLGLEGFVINAMKSGRTHNLVTDLLLQYGIIGAILYLGAYLSVVIFFIKLSRRIPSEMINEKALCTAVAIYLPFIMIYQIIGGQFMPAVVPLVAGILKARLVAYEQEKEQQKIEI